MAYGKRLQIEYKDINQVDTRVEVWQDGYVGAVTYRDYAGAEVACEVGWGDSGTKQLPLIYGSQVTLFFDTETDFEFDDFFTSNSRKNRILVYKNNNLFHVAYGEADTWSEPLIPAPYEVSFTGYDGLGLLKDEDFLTDAKAEYEGYMTPLAILALILQKTGHELNINTAVSLRANGTTGDPLIAVLKDVVSYRDLNCYEVLEALFRGCRVMQRAGEWWIISNDKFEDATFTFYKYNYAGTFISSASVSNEFSGFWFEGEGNREFLPALKEIYVIQNFGYKPNLLKNSDFSKINDAGNFDNWTAVGVTPEQRVYDADGNKFVYIPGIERLDPWDEADRTKYLVSDPITVTQASDIFNLKIGYALMGPEKNSAYVFFGLFLEGDNGIDYALEAYYYTEPDLRLVGYRWIASSHKLAVPVKAHIKTNNNWPFPKTYEVEPDRIESYPYNVVTNHFTDATIAVEGGIPTSGTIRMYLFQAHTGSIVAGNCFREIKMFITDELEQEFPTETEFSLINDRKNNFSPSEIELPHGDLPLIANKLTVYDGGFIYNGGINDGEATTLWQLDGFATTYTYAELIARLIAAEMKVARQAYQARLADVIPAVQMVFEDTSNSNIRLIEAGITYNDSMQAVEGKYVEVKTFAIDSFTVGEKITYANDNEASSKSGGGNVYDTDERVKLIDPDSLDIEGQAGYLNAEEFEQIIDENSGKAVNSYAWKVGLKASHGFVANDAIYHNGTTWLKAIADDPAHLAMGIVRKVIDSNYFVYMSEGILPGTGFTQGAWYYLSGITAGLMVTSPDSAIAQCLGFVADRGLKVEIGHSLNATVIKDWIEFEFRDVEAGTAAEYVLDIKALVGYTIDSAVLQTDDGTLTGVNVKIGATAVTGLSSVTVTTTITETAATAAKTVVAGDKVTINITTGYTGTPTLIRGKLNLTRT